MQTSSLIKQPVSYWNLHKVPILMVLASIFFYYTFAYQLERTDTLKLFGLYAVLFFFCFKLIQFEKWNFKFLLSAGLLFRFIFLLAIPNLSQDFNRFLWDGELVLQGINPYLYLPDFLITKWDVGLEQAEILLSGMGSLSAQNYSNYPPFSQWLFAGAVLLGGKSVVGSLVVLRLILITADLGIFYYGRKLLKYLNRSPHLIFWYFLNPLIIIEGVGNIHLEPVMLFFFIAAMHLLSRERWFLSALLFGLSITVKLVPLLFMTLFIPFLGIRKCLIYYSVVGATVIVCALPFISVEVLTNYSQTLGLWFSNFEFNAGLYNGIKLLGLQHDIKPWDLIKVYGKITPYITIGLVLLITFFRANKNINSLLSSMLWIVACYFFISTVVHPWYILFLILLTVFTDFRFPLFWSAVIILSYSAYANPDFKENLSLLFIQYFIVFAFMIYEIFRLKGQKLLIRKN